MSPTTKAILAVFCAVGLTSCAAVPNRDPVGEVFPTVKGESLDRRQMELPRDVLDGPVLLLVGYEQRTQFDIDRWAIGLGQLGTPVRAVEIPTVRGLVPRLISSRIDDGMRSGIPEEDWSSVVTVYADADQIVSFTGNERGLNARVLLLDDDGGVLWFHDRGFSPTVLRELDNRVRSLNSEAVSDAAGGSRG